MEDVGVICGMVAGGCIREGGQAVARLGWLWHCPTVDDDCCHIFSNDLQGKAAAVWRD